MCEGFIPFCGWMICLCVDGLQLGGPFIHEWTSGLFLPLWRLQAVLLGKCVYMYSFEYLFSIIWGTECYFHHSLTPSLDSYPSGLRKFPRGHAFTWDLYLDLLGQLWAPGIPSLGFPITLTGFVIAGCLSATSDPQFSREQGLCPSAHVGTLAHDHSTQEPCRLLTSGLLILYLMSFYKTL